MAKKPGSAPKPEPATPQQPAVRSERIPDEQHPDFVGAIVGEEMAGPSLTPGPDGPFPLPPLPQPLPMPPIPIPIPAPNLPLPIPNPLPVPFPMPPVPLNFCLPVSGRYRRMAPAILPLPQPQPFPLPMPQIQTLARFSLTARVDVDRFFPQRRISVEASRLIPRASAHLIADVTSDVCSGFNHRRITASVSYRDGEEALIPGTVIVFEASRTTGVGYDTFTLTLTGPGMTPLVHSLSFESQFFDTVEFEVDQVANAGSVVTGYDTNAHPNRPASLAAETLSLATVYQRAGFEASMSPGASVIPLADAGANGTWSDSEMHNAMVAYWSRFADRPNWAMWVLYAARHDDGRSLGGIMFDDIGPNHRQGTAIFTDSFIQDAPSGDGNPAAWRDRMQFWTAVHEMGHAFNLAHSWQKSLGSPWIPLADEPEARSFMNYPYRVAGGEATFFADFRFRFSDNDLTFMRHAPRRFVQMGNAEWFVNHAFEQPQALREPTGWTLAIRPNREANTFAFMEPVNLELKLTNETGAGRPVDEDLLNDGGHIAVFVGRDGSKPRRWNPFSTRCHLPHHKVLAPGESLYGVHLVGASTSEWLIDESGFYKVQAAVEVDGIVVMSNVLRLFVAPPASKEESRLAPDYFTEGVGRALAFDGAPELQTATDTLREVAARCPQNPAARHAEVAVTAPLLRTYKTLEVGANRSGMAVSSKAANVEEAARTQIPALTEQPDAAAATRGHINYFADMDRLAGALENAGDQKGAEKVMKISLSTMKKRKVLPEIVAKAERKLSVMA